MAWQDIAENDTHLSVRTKLNDAGYVADTAKQPGDPGLADPDWIAGSLAVDHLIAPSNLKAFLENIVMARAWVTFQGNGTGSNPGIRDSFNVADVDVFSGTGFHITFSTPMATSDFPVFGQIQKGSNTTTDDGYTGNDARGHLHCYPDSTSKCIVLPRAVGGNAFFTFYRCSVVIL